MIIKKDEISLYIESSGWIARPISDTKFVEGDKVDTKHFAGSNIHGIGIKNKVTLGKTGKRSKIIWEEFWSGFSLVGDSKISLSEQEKRYKRISDVDKHLNQMMVNNQ